MKFITFGGASSRFTPTVIFVSKVKQLAPKYKSRVYFYESFVKILIVFPFVRCDYFLCDFIGRVCIGDWLISEKVAH